MLSRELLQRMPKAELHVHLDGSLRPATLIDLAREARQTLPTTDPDALRRFMLVDDAANLAEYIARFDVTIAVLQTAEAIERVAYEMVEDAAADGVRYLEIRYCPLLSTAGGLSMDAVLDAEWRGLQRGERDFGTTARIINCSLRHYAPELSEQIARASVARRDQGVVAFDLAGGEAGNPPGVHGRAFDIAVEGLLGITVHAGEGAGAESIEGALLRCRADRIGHGTRLFESPMLEAYMRDRQIPIEINVTSNLQTRAVRTAAEHPVRRYVDAGLVCTLCTDNWLMSGVSLTDEYVLAQEALGFGRAELEGLMLNGFRAAFLPWPEKQRLLLDAATTLESLR